MKAWRVLRASSKAVRRKSSVEVAGVLLGPILARRG
jgi:hypothetical protein